MHPQLPFDGNRSETLELQEDRVLQGPTLPTSSARLVSGSRQKTRYLLLEKKNRRICIKWVLVFQHILFLVSSVCPISKKHSLKEMETWRSQRNTEWQRYAQETFFQRKLIKYVAQLFLYFLIRLSDIMKVHPERHLLIHVMVLSKKGETQIMGKEDQLNPFQLNCAGELGRKWY